jgi:alpha-ketoglutarate-dependent taurine dioxygenase
MIPGTKAEAAIFDLDNRDAYARWRDAKLADAPTAAADLLVEVADIANPSRAESEAIRDRCRRFNMAVYACRNACDDETPYRAKAQAFAQHFGLHRFEDHRSMTDDGLVAIEIVEAEEEGRKGFIPYTDRPISWHTDGYYNPLAKRIKAMTLHCLRPAPEGGVNDLFDPELAYIRLRDENPDYIRALMAPDAMTIPPRMEEGAVARAAQPGPVFAVYPDGHLHMRYTARTVSIEWKADGITRAAVAALERLLADECSPWVFRGRLEPGMGLVCNNVLHDRSAFSDNETRKRLLYRARYFDRVTDSPSRGD